MRWRAWRKVAALKLFQNSLLYLIGNIMNGLVPFLLLPILTRYLSPAELGLVVNFQLLFAVLVAFTSLNLHGSISVEYFKGHSAAFPSYVAACLVILIAAGTIAISLLQILAPYLDFLELSKEWIFWCAVSAIASGGSSILLVLWQAAERPLPYIAFQFAQVVANAVISVLLVVTFEAGADGRIIGLTAPVTLFGVLAVGWLILSGRAAGRVGWEDVSRALRFGLPLLPHAVAGIALAQGDRFIIGQRLGYHDAGVYSVAMQLMLPLIMVADAINRALSPWIFRRLKQRFHSHVAAVQLSFVFLCIGGSCLYVAVLSLSFDYLLGDAFHDALMYVYLLLPGAVAASVYFAVVNPLFYAGRTELLAAVTFSGALVYALAGWSIAGVYGGLGLAAVYSLVSIGQTLAVFLLSQKINKVPMAAGWKILRMNFIDLMRRCLP
ncbi:oligosaccharide flippase family protein [Shinella sp. H4-D48]|uniref:lipopolysaccharide biosynthesis protein n=1 Tax=Shinella sp. H4-D48 TaxID=2925841 RepID=UPI001F53D988|nr:oligosaccharide flippase family protein [Shinella sp. H4-D48]UNK38233.1 oligosaccharide flippase family protein [Shinella sp. H4-D48]